MESDLRRWIQLVEEGAGESKLAPFVTMSRDQFMGKPRITTTANARDLKPRALRTVQNLPRLPFMDGLSASYDADGAAVFKGDTVIASYNFGDTLVVDPRFRRRGIGAELVYQWRTRFPETTPAGQRTKASQALQSKVWDRIQSELNSTR